jgi:hypothetical protein
VPPRAQERGLQDTWAGGFAEGQEAGHSGSAGGESGSKLQSKGWIGVLCSGDLESLYGP